MSNLRDPTSDTAGLIDEEGGLGVTYRPRQCWCGSKNRLLIIYILLALLVVVGIAVAVAVIRTVRKYMLQTFAQIRLLIWICNWPADPLHVQ